MRGVAAYLRSSVITLIYVGFILKGKTLMSNLNAMDLTGCYCVKSQMTALDILTDVDN